MDKFIKSAVLVLFMLASAISIKAYNSDDVFFFVVPKGYTMTTLSNTLSVSQEVLYKYNPNLRDGLRAGIQIYLPATAVSEDNLKKVDAAPTFAGGALNSVYSFALSEYGKSVQKQNELDNRFVGMSVKDRIKQGGQLYHYDKISIDGRPFWSLNNIHSDVTANQISETTGIPLDQLKLYCKYASELTIYGEGQHDLRFADVCDYYLSHPNTTIKDLKRISYAKYGRNYIISIKIPDDLSELKNNTNGLVDYPKGISSTRAQDMSSTDNLKTYNGSFNLKGFGFWTNSRTMDGSATYQYKEASDGSRIFEGEFSFSHKPGGPYGATAIAKGYFKDNKQVGLWTWDYSHYNSDNIHTEIIFTEDGIPISFDTSKADSYATAKFKNGKLVSLYFQDRNNFYCNGEYNLEGKPIGDWKAGGYGHHSFVMSFDNTGKLAKSGYRDNSTGDWIHSWPSMDYEPSQLYYFIIGIIQNGYFFRSTSF